MKNGQENYFSSEETPTEQPSEKTDKDFFILETRFKELSHAYESLKEAHASYLFFFEQSPIGHLIIDPRGKVVESNPSVTQLLDSVPLIGQSFSRYVHPDFQNEFSVHLSECAQNENKKRQCEITVGNKKVQLTSILSQGLIKMALVDLSEAVRANNLESESKHLHDERSLREHFVNTLSHDLRAPLTSAKLCSQMLMANLKNSLEIAKVKRLFELQVDELDRADRMIRELLDANKIMDPQGLPLVMKKCDLNKIARRTIEILCSVYKERITFNYVVTGDVTGVWSKDGIHRVLENLVINAIKYGDTERPISIMVEDRDNHVCLKVHNFGTPIDPKNQKLIFEAFHRTAEACSSSAIGWGLGLSLVNTLVQKHRGEIKLESSAQEGTTFEVLLPKK